MKHKYQVRLGSFVTEVSNGIELDELIAEYAQRGVDLSDFKIEAVSIDQTILAGRSDT